MSVPPVARAMEKLINDLTEASYKLKYGRTHKKVQSTFDVTKMGLRFAFHEGLGFIEYVNAENAKVVNEQKPISPTETTLINTEKKATSDSKEPLTSNEDKSKHSINRIYCELKVTKTW